MPPALSCSLPLVIFVAHPNNNCCSSSCLPAFLPAPASSPPLPACPLLQVSLINLNDGTCAGMMHPGLKAMTVQSHPEASPGPHDSDVAFGQFIDWMTAKA